MKSIQPSANTRRDDPCYGSFFGFGNHIYNGILKEFAGTTEEENFDLLSSFSFNLVSSLLNFLVSSLT
jgi:hypothetical protein